MRPVGSGPAGSRARIIDDAGAPIDAVLARAEVEISDDVETAAGLLPGADAVATGGTGGRARDAAVAMFGALTRVPGEIPELRADFGAFTDALASARAQTAGDLGDVLDKYIAMRRRIAQHVGSISSG